MKRIGVLVVGSLQESLRDKVILSRLVRVWTRKRICAGIIVCFLTLFRRCGPHTSFSQRYTCSCAYLLSITLPLCVFL